MSSNKFRNRYRIPTARAQWHNYCDGTYFVTICTKHRECFFGEIINANLRATETGKIAEKFWLEIPNHFPFVVLDQFVIMPNHIHGILIFNKPITIATAAVETHNCASLQSPIASLQSPTASSQSSIAFPQSRQQSQSNKFGRQSQNLGSVIRGFKSSLKRYTNENNINFAWQSRFHDHIIRNATEHQRIVDYITTNPANWENDILNAPL